MFAKASSRGVARALLGLVLAWLAPAPPIAAAAEPAAPAGIPWEKDFKSALRSAKAAGKPIMVDFWASWCHWCHQLDETTYRDAKVAGLARDFVAVKVNTEGGLEERQLTSQYGVETLPTIAFLSPQGRLFFLRSEFENPERFSATLETARALAKDTIAWEAALAKDHHDAAALAGLGHLLVGQGLVANGRELLREARKSDQGLAVAERKRLRRELSLAERQASRWAESERLLEEAVALQPVVAEEDGAALFALGDAYLQRGDVARARTTWKRCLELAPDGPWAARSQHALAALP